MSRSFSSMIYSKSFIVSHLMFKSLIHFEFIGVWCQIQTHLHSFAYGYLVSPTSFVEDTIFSPLCMHAALILGSLLHSFGLYVCLYACKLKQTYCFNYCSCYTAKKITECKSTVRNRKRNWKPYLTRD